MREAGIAEIIQQHAVAVGEHDGVIGFGDLLEQGCHLTLCGKQDGDKLFLALQQLLLFDHVEFPGQCRVELVFVRAADPRIHDVARNMQRCRRRCMDDLANAGAVTVHAYHLVS